MRRITLWRRSMTAGDLAIVASSAVIDRRYSVIRVIGGSTPFSGCQRVPLFDFGPDALTAFFGRDLDIFHLRGFGSQFQILDDGAEPSRDVALFQMIQPGVVIDALSHL